MYKTKCQQNGPAVCEHGGIIIKYKKYFTSWRQLGLLGVFKRNKVVRIFLSKWRNPVRIHNKPCGLGPTIPDIRSCVMEVKLLNVKFPLNRNQKRIQSVYVCHSYMMSNEPGVKTTCGCGLVGVLKGITCCHLNHPSRLQNKLMWHPFSTPKTRCNERHRESEREPQLSNSEHSQPMLATNQKFQSSKKRPTH